MKIALLEPLNIPGNLLEEMAAPLKARGHEFTRYDTKAAGPEELIRRAHDMDIVMIANTPFPEDVVKACPKLQYINVAFTGVDHVAMAECRRRGIQVSNAANYSNQSVAELTVGMAVSLLRRMPACDEAVRNGGTGALLLGREICGRTVGIIGTGRIGLRVARLMLAFGAHVIAFDPVPSEEGRALGIEYVALPALLSRSDIVTLHAPACEATRKMLGAREFALMKPSALFINCARGALVDAQALCDALNSGRIAGAAVDVFDMEPPLPEGEPLLHARNIILTPHIAYATEESMLRRARIAFDSLTAWLDGNPQNLC